jgi:PhnB protein
MDTRPIPEGYHTVTPILTIKNGLEALEFYRRAFGATVQGKMVMPDGRLGHAAIRIGDSVIMAGEECPEQGGKSPRTLGGTPVSLYLYVEDVDAFFKRALAAGATHKEDVSPEEMQERLQAMATAKK